LECLKCIRKNKLCKGAVGMRNKELVVAFKDLSTPLISDACMRLNIRLRIAPAGIRPVKPEMRLAGKVQPVRHYGSVDIFLEAIENAGEGDVLVIDSEGRADEGCIGDLTVLEAQVCALGGLVVWGYHRDDLELANIGYPVFSYGTFPAGPRRLNQRHPEALVSAKFGDIEVGLNDVVFADIDGAVFVPKGRVQEVVTMAQSIWEKERQQARLIKAGTTLRQQLKFNEYIEERNSTPGYTFRQHLKKIGGAIEE